jgi:GNAT superfamily N-acetyltransferase
MREISYRRFTKDDIPRFVDYRICFLEELQGEHSADKVRRLRMELDAYFEKAFDDSTFIAWIAELGQEFIGFGGMTIQHIPANFRIKNGLQGFILNMYTVPEHRRKGVCSKILEKLIEDGRRMGVSRIYLHASPDGINLYRGKGFVEPELPELELQE